VTASSSRGRRDHDARDLGLGGRRPTPAPPRRRARHPAAWYVAATLGSLVINQRCADPALGPEHVHAGLPRRGSSTAASSPTASSSVSTYGESCLGSPTMIQRLRQDGGHQELLERGLRRLIQDHHVEQRPGAAATPRLAGYRGAADLGVLQDADGRTAHQVGGVEHHPLDGPPASPQALEQELLRGRAGSLALEVGPQRSLLGREARAQAIRAHGLRDVALVADPHRDEVAAVLELDHPLEHVVDGDVSGRAQQHALAGGDHLQDQLADRGGLPRPRRALEHGEVRRRQGAAHELSLRLGAGPVGVGEDPPGRLGRGNDGGPGDALDREQELDQRAEGFGRRVLELLDGADLLADDVGVRPERDHGAAVVERRQAIEQQQAGARVAVADRDAVLGEPAKARSLGRGLVVGRGGVAILVVLVVTPRRPLVHVARAFIEERRHGGLDLLDAALGAAVVELDPDARRRLVALGRPCPVGRLGAGPADPQDRLVALEVALQRLQVAVQVAEAVVDVALRAVEVGRETQVRVLQEAHLVTPREVRVDRGRSSLEQRACQAKTSWRGEDERAVGRGDSLEAGRAARRSG
jgi:hypothetical protein